MSRKVPIESLFSLVINDLPNVNISQEQDKIMQWCKFAILRIGSAGVALPHRECVIDIINYRGQLPADFYKIVSVKTDTYTYAVYAGDSFVYFDKDNPYLAVRDSSITVPYAGCVWGTARYNIQGNYLYIDPNLPQVGISYSSLPVDNRGMLLVDDLHLEAITSYVRFRLISSRYFSEKTTRGVYLDAKTEWEQDRTRAQYIDAQVSPDEAEYVASIYSMHFPGENQPWGFGSLNGSFQSTNLY